MDDAVDLLSGITDTEIAIAARAIWRIPPDPDWMKHARSCLCCAALVRREAEAMPRREISGPLRWDHGLQDFVEDAPHGA